MREPAREDVQQDGLRHRPAAHDPPVERTRLRPFWRRRESSIPEDEAATECHNQFGDPCDNGLLVPAHAFWIVCLTVFIDSLGGSISGPVLPFYAKEFNCTKQDVGALFSAFSLAQVVFLPVMGKLSDCLGRRSVLVCSLFGAALGAWAQGLAPTYWALLLARVISGGCGAVGSTANVYVSDITSESVRGLYLGYLMNSNGAAFAFGPGLGGGLSKLGLNVPIQVNGCLCFISGLLALVYLPESPAFLNHQQALQRTADREEGADEQKKATIPTALYAVFAVEFLRGFSFSAIFALFGLFASETFGFDSLHIGYTVCVGAIVLICSNVWLLRPSVAMFGEVGSAAFGVTVMAVGEITLAYAPSMQVSLAGVWSVYMGQAIAGSNIAAITSILSTDDNRGEVMSMQQTAQALGRVIGPIWLGGIADPRQPFAIAAVCVLLAAVLLMSIRSSYSTVEIHPDLDEPLLASEAGGSRKGSKSSPLRVSEPATDEDVLELGKFLCDLLEQGGYKWHDKEHRAALKKALGLYFPPLGSESAPPKSVSISALAPVSPHPASRAKSNRDLPVHSIGAELNISGDDSNFLRSPALGRSPGSRRRYYANQSSKT